MWWIVGFLVAFLILLVLLGREEDASVDDVEKAFFRKGGFHD